MTNVSAPASAGSCFTRREFLQAGGLSLLALTSKGSFATAPSKITVSDALGMNLYLSCRYPRRQLKPVAALAWHAGVRWIRQPMAWALVEKQPGRWDWSRFDLAVNVAHAQGLSILGILGGPPAWGTMVDAKTPKVLHSMPKPGPWRKYVTEIVRRYKGAVQCWEAANEPNFPYSWRPKPNPAEYSAFLKETYEAVKAADPDALTVAMATRGCDVKFIEAVLQDGGARYTETVSVQPYTDAKGPEAGSQNAGLEHTYDLIQKYHLDPRIWITEFGWGTFDDGKNGVTAEVQADYLIRGYVLALSSPGVQKVFWYCFRDEIAPSPKDFPKAWEYTRFYGITDRNLRPKPAYTACQTISRELAGLSFERRLATGPDAYAFCFGNGQRTVAVCWSLQEGREIRLPLGTAWPGAVSAQGRQANFAIEDRAAVIKATPSPVFVSL